MLYALRRWLWTRLFYFDHIAVKCCAWCLRAGRCIGCAAHLRQDELQYYGHSCERCETHEESSLTMPGPWL